MTIIDEILEKFDRYERRRFSFDIPESLKVFFDYYKKNLRNINPANLKKGNNRYRVDEFSKLFKVYLETYHGWGVYPEINLKEPKKLFGLNIFNTRNNPSLIKSNYSYDLEHLFKKIKKIDFIAIREKDKKILFIETKISPDLSKFFDAFFEFSMIDTEAIDDNYQQYFIILADYGGNPFTPKPKGQINRPDQLNCEFNFIKSLFQFYLFCKNLYIFFIRCKNFKFSNTFHFF